ncbi:MAG: DUF547 domain-containing protein [Porticoccus sp.]
MTIKFVTEPKLRNIFLMAGLSVLSIFSHLSLAAPESNVQGFWSESNESNISIIEHSTWQTLLDVYLNNKHPSGINRFDYAAVNTEDHKRLDSYLQQMQQLDPRAFNRTEQKAYWINLYNALTVELILKNYPTESITKLGKSFFSFGPWDDKIANIQGHELSLNDIEHGILRPLFQDNRIHYAVNCASLSCPNLSATAYTSANIHSQLEQAAKLYVNHPRGVTFEDGTLKVSNIYQWYKEDFGGNDKTLLSHLTHYAEPSLAERLRHYQADIEYHYNWKLNQP